MIKKDVKILVIHEWPTEADICHEVVDIMPEKWDDDETYYEVIQKSLYDDICAKQNYYKELFENRNRQCSELLARVKCTEAEKIQLQADLAEAMAVAESYMEDM